MAAVDEELIMSRRRSEVQILAEILNLSLSGAKFTHLMYKANLSYTSLNRYLMKMKKKGLIQVFSRNQSAVYVTSEKGRLLLGQLREIEKVLPV
jgi:predicted transcriptional regulator